MYLQFHVVVDIFHPHLKRAYQSMNQISLYEQVRCSSAFDECYQLNENRPPDAQFFLEDDDTEVAQAFGLEIRNKSSKTKINSNSIECIICT